MLRESARLNGLTDVALTKLDVLSGFDTIQICVAYEYKGKRMDYPPQEQGALDLVSPVYESMPGWKEDITACKTWDELPEAARAYVQRLEQLSGVPVSMVSVAPTAIRLFSDKGMDRGRNLSEERLPLPAPLPKLCDSGEVARRQPPFLYRKRTSCI